MVWVVNATPGRLPAGKDPVRIVQDTVWVIVSVWTGAENLTPAGIQYPDRPNRSEFEMTVYVSVDNNFR
jgi:hypothetical protein